MALVGYTNAGKSTLLNRLTDAEVLTEDRLFSTLDSTVRKLHLPSGPAAVISDTVGFVRRLPHHLVEAFRSTLIEVREADLLLQVVDATDPDPAGQIDAVREVLVEIDADRIPQRLVFNKIDMMGDTSLRRLQNLYPDASFVSARTGDQIDVLEAAMAGDLEDQTTLLRLAIPYERGDIVASAHRLGDVVAEKHDEHGTVLDVRVPAHAVGSFQPFTTD